MNFSERQSIRQFANVISVVSRLSLPSEFG